ncbi:MAG: anhydro-N-acetylmuramic acid kinase [Pseudomonadota bacterium]
MPNKATSNHQWAVGLMTGTVLDGNIDVALIHSDGIVIDHFGAWQLSTYPPEVRRMIARALAQARAWSFKDLPPPSFALAQDALTRAQAEAVNTLIAEAGLTAKDIDIIGFHGQTIKHQAPTKGQQGRTLQLADGPLMAHLTGIDVAFDFRSNDMSNGGQGAPLAACFHAALLSQAKIPTPCAVLNLGGVGNITWFGGGDALYAFDTGPANAPINDWVARHTDAVMDTGGALAAQGHVDQQRLESWLAHPYFASPPPKSLDRFDFSATLAEGLSLVDGAASLTALCVAAVAHGLDHLPHKPCEIIVSGGGRKNPVMMAMLAEWTGVTVRPAEAVHWSGDAIEAQCFAYLARRVRKGLPISFPATTGVPRPLIGGRIAWA